MKCCSQPHTPNHYRINKTNPTKWNTTATFCCISCSFEPNFSAYISFICADLRAPKTLEILFCWLFPVTLRNVGSSWNGKHILNYFSFVENKLHYSAFATRNICFFSVAIVFPLLIHCILLVASWRNYCCYLGALLFCEMFRLAALFHTLLPMFFLFLLLAISDEFRSKIACENDVIQLICNPYSRIAIYSASYGRTEYESLQCSQPQGVKEESKFYVFFCWWMFMNNTENMHNTTHFTDNINYARYFFQLFCLHNKNETIT